jgi:hypothetical protein
MPLDPLIALKMKDRRDLFTEVGARHGLHPVLVEKDYWVCRTLGVLFDPTAPMGSLIFKGGTSLSKAYGLIKRFSEDVDVAFDKRQFGFEGERDPENVSKGRAKDLIEELAKAVGEHVSGPYRQDLSRRLGGLLGAEGWTLNPDPGDPTTLLLAYPQSLGGTLYNDAAYVRPVVKLEHGARSDPWPAEARMVLPYAAEVFPAVVGEAGSPVSALSPARTFWEKATILHAEAHRAGGGVDRISRHYYDLAQLAASDYGSTALADTTLRERVATHKALYFRSGWARYDLATPPTFRLIPNEDRLKALAADYRSMSSMFFEEPPKFSDLVDQLRELESTINAPVTTAETIGDKSGAFASDSVTDGPGD